MISTALLAASLCGAAQARTGDPLAPLAQCLSQDAFHEKQRDRLPETVTAREVATASGTARVTLADGYRLLMVRKGSEPLVNLKVELSAAGQFSRDRAAIVAQMEALAASSKAQSKVQLEQRTQDGIEILALNNPLMTQSTGITGLYTLLDARNGVVATAYMLNQRADIREYKDDTEYVAIRDHFIAVLGKCMAQQAR